MAQRISPGCGRTGCDCPYCNGDNYDRYISDHLREMLDGLNFSLPNPININDDKIKGDEELYYHIIQSKVLESLNMPNNPLLLNET
tara:strand:- start:37 stop:294 length:258 start_codon:yes stop_codon:yes gene_type:complete